ncbi:long-chain fatty acid--CoA ligase [Nocardioides sp. cx-173]|uniref:AMP-dependent synthetase/ligase n=1 Tax=Nocardioides sp. cx-173 TaxID=2898796 RepID=UPI001E417949|nr:AMP-dependent synthetase/ligase [Nocardioides sp. cx-173]MCD4524615.1 AMP-dependent synthetase/ligase [Nocardioides sp. cx-173]UGB42903.1 AMP-dependent synthetase/ligase [Nocardioides sp. cx-173]
MSNDVLAERARIEAAIAGQTLADALLRTVTQYADQPAYSDRHHRVGDEAWRTLTWREVREGALDVAAGLMELGVARGDTVAVMATNRIEHVLADLGSVHAAATPMSIYNTLSAEQVAFVAGHAEPTVVILENADHLARWGRALDESASVRRVVLIDAAAAPQGDRFTTWDDLVASGRAYRADHAEEVESRRGELTPDSAATILYTSGTTGNPKGVVLSHFNVLYEALSTLEAAGLEGGQRQVSYLPFAHIAERVLGIYGPQFVGGHIHCIGDPSELLAALGEVHPTAFFGVPRVWEKIKTGLSAKLAADPDPANVKMVQDSMAAALAWVEAQEYGATMTPEIDEAYQAADAAILGFLKLLLGLDQVTWAASAAAPMPLEVARFMAGLGLKVYDVYGMTETCGAVTANGPSGFKLGTVGRATPGMELRLGDDGEVLVRGPVNTSGYHRQEEATRALIDEDGWVHTGDIGTVDEDGFFSIVDRKKELIITSAGKNIAPSNIENYLKESPIIGHAMAVGDARPYVVAILTLDSEVAPAVAQQLGVEFQDLADLAQRPEILAMAQAAVDSANERLSRPEQVKAFELLPVEWTAESEELTPTLKLKRRVVNQKYSDVLERLYG